jgi:glycosyltransferase involved in cell wall biosynthesis
MRVLQIIDHLGLGGAQVWLLDVNAHWPCPTDVREGIGLGRKHALADRWGQESGVEWECWKTAPWDPTAFSKIWKRVRQVRYDIVHVHLQRATWLGWLATLNQSTPLLIHVRAPTFVAQLKIILALARRFPKRDMGIATVSGHIATALRQAQLVPEDRLWTLLNGVSLRRLASAAMSEASVLSLRDTWAIPRSAFVVLYAGRLSRIKQLPILLQALQQSDPNVFAVLVGEGPLRKALEREVAERGLGSRVRFTGFQSNVVPWLQASDACVLPSQSEGLPVSLLEAGAVGKPLIATAVGGVPELITHGQTGLLIPTGNADALANTIRQLHQSPDLCHQLGDAARQHVSRFHSMDHVARQVRTIYDKLVQSG